MNMGMNIVKGKINNKNIHKKHVEKQGNKQWSKKLANNNNGEDNYKFLSELEKFSLVEKENMKKCENYKEDDERKEEIKCELVDGEIQILANDVLVDKDITNNEVLEEEQLNDINDLSIKEEIVKLDGITNYHYLEDKSNTYEIHRTELKNDSNSIKYANVLSDIKIVETVDEKKNISLNQSTIKNTVSEILYNTNDEEIMVKTKELRAANIGDLNTTIDKITNNKDGLSLLMSEKLDDNKNLLNEVVIERVNNGEEKIIKVETKKQLNIENDVSINEKEENNVFMQSDNFADNTSHLSKGKNNNIKIDNSVVEDLSSENSYIAEKRLEEFSIIQQMTKSIKTSKFIDGKSITVKLKPEYLGDMTINIRELGDKIIARISADRENVKNTISSHIGEITTLLSEKMIKIDEIIVDSVQQEINGDKNLASESSSDSMSNMSDKNSDDEYNQRGKKNRLNFTNDEDSAIANKNELNDQILKYRGFNLYV